MTSKDDDEGESIKVSSRKADKKTNRALAILKNDTGIIESNNPTSIIFVCNAGNVMEQQTLFLSNEYVMTNFKCKSKNNFNSDD